MLGVCVGAECGMAPAHQPAAGTPARARSLLSHPLCCLLVQQISELGIRQPQVGISHGPCLHHCLPGRIPFAARAQVGHLLD